MQVPLYEVEELLAESLEVDLCEVQEEHGIALRETAFIYASLVYTCNSP